MMRSRADLGVVTHLTLQELRGPAAAASAWCDGGGVVSVVENPQVLQAAAKARVVRTPVATVWDPRLAVEMERLRIAVHEELVLGTLLEDLH